MTREGNKMPDAVKAHPRTVPSIAYHVHFSRLLLFWPKPLRIEENMQPRVPVIAALTTCGQVILRTWCPAIIFVGCPAMTGAREADRLDPPPFSPTGGTLA